MNNKFSKIARCALWTGLALVLWLPAGHAKPGIEVEDSGANFGTARYEEVVVDMRIKVMGGMVTVKRQWRNGRWTFNPEWQDLGLHYTTAGGLTSPGGTTPPEDIDPGEPPDSVSRNGFTYQRDSDTSSVYVYDKRKTITRGEDGYRWTDREGNWIDYDLEGNILAYGDRNDVTVSFTRDAEGRIATVRDHFDTAVLTFTYDGQGRPLAITDYTDRVVEYTYTGGDLTTMTDVRGYDWQYSYETLLGKRVMQTKTDPEGRVVHINHVVSGGGRVCVESDAGDWVFNEETNRWEQTGGQCLKWAILPETLMLLGIYDEIGQRTKNRYFYDADSKTYTNTRVTAGRGRVTETYNLKGEVISEEINGEVQSETVISTDRRRRVETDRNGYKTTYYYDEYENQTGIDYPDGSSERWTYDKFSNVLTYTNENGVTTNNEYDENGNLIRKTEALGKPAERVTEYSYDQYGNRTEMRQLADADTELAVTQWTYDDYGNVTSEIDPEGNETEYTRDVLGNMLTEVDPRDNTWTQTYDAAGNLLTETTPLDHTTTYKYDKVGNQVEVIDALEHSTQFTYNARDRAIRQTDALGNETVFKMNQQGQVTKVVDKGGHSVRFEYDTYGRVFKKTDEAGNTTTFEYGQGNAGLQQLSKVVYPTYTERRYYDKRERMVRSSQILSENEVLDTYYEYDAAGNQISVTDPAGRIRKTEYDALDRAIARIAPDTTTTLYAYDDRDNLIRVTNARNVVLRRYQYDRENRRIGETWPAGQHFSYEYDGNDNLTTHADAEGQVTRHEYTAESHRIVSRYFETAGAETPVRTTNYTYNVIGRLTSYDDGQTQGTFTYDPLQRKTSETIDYGEFTLGHSYTYTSTGRKASLTYPDGTTIGYNYNEANRFDRINIPEQGNITVNGYHWRAPQGITLPGGTRQTNTYDELLRVKRITAKDPGDAPLMDLTYTRDEAGNIVNKSTLEGNSEYEYDLLDRLTAASHPELDDEEYTYDPAGNRLTSNETGDSKWQYGDNNQLLANSMASYDYNLNGSITERVQGNKTTHFMYNIRDRLTEIRNADDSPIAQYLYDPLGRRIAKTVGRDTTYFHYSDQGLIGEYDSAGTPKQTYGYTPGNSWGTNPIFTRIEDSYLYYLNDYLGTPELLVDAAGSVQWSLIGRTAFGETRINPGSDIENNLRFPGQYFDRETGFHYNYFRDYDPNIGRYIEADPIGLAGGLNIYNYAMLNPVLNVDVYGLKACCQKQTVTDMQCVIAMNATYRACIDFAKVKKGYCKVLCTKVPGLSGKLCGKLCPPGHKNCNKYLQRDLLKCIKEVCK